MNKKTLKKTALSLLAGGGAAMGGTFVWTGGVGTPWPWNDPDDWECIASPCGQGYPSSSSDDAIMEWNGSVSVPQDERIDDLTIYNSGSQGGPTFFRQQAATTTITSDTVTISGANSARTIVKVTELVRIRTN